MANVADNLKRLFSFQSETEIALKETKAALTERDSQISALQEAVTALKAKADDSDSDDSSDSDSDKSEVEQIIDAIEKALQPFKGDDTSDSDESTDSDDSSDSDDSDTDDATDESAKASAADKLKSILTHVHKLNAELKAEKASATQKAIREIAKVGIPTAITTKTEGTKATSGLTGIARAAAAWNEQLKGK